MSEQTEKALEAARERLQTAQAEADEKQRETLESIAENLPEKADAIAKRYAHDQPEVTKSIGREGTVALRAAVAREAAILGAAFVAAVDEIKWPSSDSQYSKVETRHIHGAIFTRFYREVDGIVRPIKDAGYDVPGQIVPQQLYEENRFADLAMAMTALSAAQRDVEAARAADDKSAVDDLWN